MVVLVSELALVAVLAGLLPTRVRGAVVNAIVVLGVGAVALRVIT